MKQVSGCFIARKSLPQLLRGPRRCWMCGDRDVLDPSPVMGEEDEDEQQTARCRRDHEEVRGHNLADMVAEERAPGLRGRLALPDHVLRHRRF